MLLALPIELTSQILAEWLSWKDVVQVDCAFCNAAKRKVLCESVFQSDLFTLKAPSKSSPATVGHYIMWIAKRKIIVDTIFLSDDCDWVVCEEYLQGFGQHVKHAQLDNLDENSFTALSLITRYCPNLTNFRFKNSLLGSTAPVEQLLLACTKLDSVEFTSIGCDDAEDPAPQTSPINGVVKARSVDLRWCDNTLLDVVMPALQPEFVVKLRTDRPDSIALPNWHKYRNLRSLSLYHHTLGDNEHLLTILSQCPQIVNLDVSHTPCADALSTALWMLKELYSINLDGVHVQDGFVRDLAQRYKHSLTTLHMRNVFVTGDVINEVLAHCTNLRTIGYQVEEGINYALMKNITKLVCDYETGDSMWQSVQQHCRSLQQLFLKLGTTFVESPAMIIALKSLPVLQEVSFFDANNSMRSAQMLSVRKQLPNVRVVHGDSAKWYDLFELPV